MGAFETGPRFQHWMVHRSPLLSRDRTSLTKDQFISQIIVDKDVKLPNGKLLKLLRNDGYVIFSGDGKIIEERSFAQILLIMDIGLLLGSKWQGDRIHLNDGVYLRDRWVCKRGDIMMSSRHLSVLALQT